MNPTGPVAAPQTQDVENAARALGLKRAVLNAVSEDDFHRAFAGLAEQRADALFVGADPLFANRRDRLVALAAQYAVPAIYEFCEFVEAGGEAS